ncbi:MAG: hypothetical protein MJ248_02705 [Bacilli bacterium]|nr:hypothetical protein [Bacilli bacterium]
MKNFVIKYGKWVAVAVAVITFGLLAIPGFFQLKSQTYSGYEMIFRASFEKGSDFNYLKNNGNYDVCVIGIIALVGTLVSAIMIAFDKESCALDVFGGILLAFSGLVFLAMQGWAVICYKVTDIEACRINFISYLIGAFQLIAGVAMAYKGFTILKEEKSNPKSVSYSYLKKSK